MQPAKDRIDTDGIRFSATMARIWTWVFKIGERRIGSTGTRRHVRAPGIVMRNPRFEDAPQMRFRQGNQPIQALATKCATREIRVTASIRRGLIPRSL